MRNKICSAAFAILLAIFGFMIWADQRRFLLELKSYDVDRRVLMVEIDDFVMGVAGALVMFFGSICLAIYLKLRKLERQLEVIRSSTSSELHT